MVMPQPRRIIISEPVPPIVAVSAELGLSFDRFELTGVRPESKVAAADADRRPIWMFDAGNPSAAIPIRAVDPVVEAVVEAVQAMLLIACDKPSKERLALVCLAVTIGVLGVENLRRGRDQNSVAPWH